MHEIWMPVAGYESFYEVSNYGEVRSMDRIVKYKPSKTRSVSGHDRILNGRVLQPALTSSGYLGVGLSIGHGGKTHHIHRMVGQAFLPNPFELPDINHIDGDKTNNSASNLEWCTEAENIEHAVRTGNFGYRKGEKASGVKLNNSQVGEIRELLTGGVSQRKIAALYGVSQKAISMINTRKNWSHI